MPQVATLIALGALLATPVKATRRKIPTAAHIPGKDRTSSDMNMTDHPHNDPTAVSAGRTNAEAETGPAEPARPPVQRPGPDAHAPPVLRETVGDPVCWLHEVCPGCGLFIGDNPPITCPRCGETVPA